MAGEHCYNMSSPSSEWDSPLAEQSNHTFSPHGIHEMVLLWIFDFSPLLSALKCPKSKALNVFPQGLLALGPLPRVDPGCPGETHLRSMRSKAQGSELRHLCRHLLLATCSKLILQQPNLEGWLPLGLPAILSSTHCIRSYINIINTLTFQAFTRGQSDRHYRRR